MTIIPCSPTFDQQTLTLMLEHDPVVQRSRAFFALFEWHVVPEPPIDPSQPGKRPHPQRAYIKALLLKVEEDLTTCTRLRRFLVEHPRLLLELGFRPVLDVSQPSGFDVERTVPSARWLREKQRSLEQPVLQALLLETVQALREEIPGLGEIVAFDVTHIYAWVPRKQLARLRQRALQERPATQRRPRLPTGRQKKPQSAASRWLQKGTQGIALGLWQWRGHGHRGWLWRCDPGRVHPTL
jgi:hypothetical protein